MAEKRYLIPLENQGVAFGRIQIGPRFLDVTAPGFEWFGLREYGNSFSLITVRGSDDFLYALEKAAGADLVEVTDSVIDDPAQVISLAKSCGFPADFIRPGMSWSEFEALFQQYAEVSDIYRRETSREISADLPSLDVHYDDLEDDEKAKLESLRIGIGLEEKGTVSEMIAAAVNKVEKKGRTRRK